MFVYAQFLLKKTLVILKMQNGFVYFAQKLSGKFLTDSPYQERHRFFYTVIEEIS